MNDIKSLANQLRDQLRTGGNKNNIEQTGTKKNDLSTDKKQNKHSASEEKAAALFNAILDFKVETTEKSLIRVDKKTMNLLKRIKLTKGVDMNRFIVYCLHQYIEQHPWLTDHINETLKNTAP